MIMLILTSTEMLLMQQIFSNCNPGSRPGLIPDEEALRRWETRNSVDKNEPRPAEGPGALPDYSDPVCCDV